MDLIVSHIFITATLITFLSLVENESHCEFVPLRNFLMRTHLQDMIETTALVHYETFRTKQLLALKESTSLGSGGGGNPPARSNTGGGGGGGH